jgi:catechol 2,3-dioxygenase-like lactoylglutathione lyase family enzyme
MLKFPTVADFRKRQPARDQTHIPPSDHTPEAGARSARIVCKHADMSDSSGPSTPTLRQVVLDCEDARALAEFYRQLLGFRYRPGDEPPADGRPDTRGADWLVLCDATGSPRLAFQQVPSLPEPTWPEGPRPQMLHLDTTVPTLGDLRIQHERALALGARLLLDRSDDEEEPLFVYADPAGHPFCIFVGAES